MGKIGEPVVFIVPGDPVAKGRPRVDSRGKFVRVYTPEKTVNYEGLVAHTAQSEMGDQPLFAGAVSVEMDIRLSIPSSWSQKKQALAVNGGIEPTKKPDIDNVEKIIFDGLNGVVWVDDVQVVGVKKRKRYSTIPGVWVKITEIK
jgi:Holliday junction resolvase RusA-like endonuclease